MGFLNEALKLASGESSTERRMSDHLLFDKMIGFRGIIGGVGVSTLVQNVAIAIANRKHYTVCVVDTNFMYPSQYALLTSVRPNSHIHDLLDYTGSLKEVLVKSKYRNIYVAGMHNRFITDMLNPQKDNSTHMVGFLNALKDYFDVVLIDIGQEQTRFMIESAIQCNRIYTVLTPGVGCLTSIQKSINTMSTLALPFYKCRRCIVNKDLPDVNSGVKDTVKAFKFTLIGSIPVSNDIAVAGVTGVNLWGAVTDSEDVTIFNKTVDALVQDITNGADDPAENIAIEV